MSKVILVDSSMLFHATVYTWARKNSENNGSFVLPSTCMYLNSLFSCLAKVGVQKDDKIIIALEGSSWRKKYYAPYKAQRAERREKDSFDWNEQYQLLNECHRQLEEATNWLFVREWKYCEADDIISIACRYFRDQEIVIVTGDKDLFQLSYYPNVKIFSLNKKINNSKGFYDRIKNPLKIINDKVKKGDVSDNILVDPEHDDEIIIELREYIVNLLKLPDFVEEAGIDAIEKELKKEKTINTKKLPKFKNIDWVEQRFNKIYDGSKIVTQEECFEILDEKEELEKEKRRKKKCVNS